MEVEGIGLGGLEGGGIVPGGWGVVGENLMPKAREFPRLEPHFRWPL